MRRTAFWLHPALGVPLCASLPIGRELPTRAETVAICVGFESAATVRQAHNTDAVTVAVFESAHLPQITVAFRRRYPDARVTVVASPSSRAEAACRVTDALLLIRN